MSWVTKKRKKKCYMIFPPYSQWNEILVGEAFIFWLGLGSLGYELIKIMSNSRNELFQKIEVIAYSAKCKMRPKQICNKFEQSTFCKYTTTIWNFLVHKMIV